MAEALAAPQVGSADFINFGFDEGIHQFETAPTEIAPTFDSIVEAPVAETQVQSKNLRRAGAVLLAAAAVASFGHAEKAEASTVSPIITNTEITSGVVVGASSSSVESLASGKVVILGNMKVKGLPKKQIRKLEKQGKCKVLDGNEVDIWTQGRAEKGKPYGKDTRTSEFCKIGKNWVRVLCKNPAKFKQPKRVVKAPVIWVKNYLKAKMNLTVNAKANAEAMCKTANSYAYAYGHGEASASAILSVRARMKARGKGLREVTANITGNMSGEAQAKASAQAVAICVESGGTVVPKDGTQGSGEGTPGNTSPDGTGIGGTGAGGTAGDPTGEVCRDTTDPNTGDYNAQTEGDIVVGKSDQFGYCV